MIKIGSHRVKNQPAVNTAQSQPSKPAPAPQAPKQSGPRPLTKQHQRLSIAKESSTEKNLQANMQQKNLANQLPADGVATRARANAHGESTSPKFGRERSNAHGASDIPKLQGRERAHAMGKMSLPVVDVPKVETTLNGGFKVNGNEYNKVGKMPFAGGAMGYVWKLESSNQNAQPLVLKNVRGENPAKVSMAIDREAKAHIQAGDHPNIVKFYGKSDIGGDKGLVMEFIGGGDLDKAQNDLRKMHAAGQINHTEYYGTQQYLLKGTLKGLEHAEARGVVHHDIKPENIMLDPKTLQPKIADFGIGSVQGKADWFGGTKNYMSPEAIQALEKPEVAPTGKADVFSVGQMAYIAGPGQGTEFEVKKSFQGPAVSPLEEKKIGNEPTVRVGGHGNTEMVKFINSTMAASAENRPTATQALNHPFLTDPLLSDEQAQNVLKKMLTYRADKTIGAAPKETPKQYWSPSRPQEAPQHNMIKHQMQQELKEKTPRVD